MSRSRDEVQVHRRAETRQQTFRTLCATIGIEHWLTSPRSPQTKGMVKRVNGRIKDVLQSQHVRSGIELGTTLHRYIWLNNHPACTIKIWQQNALASHETTAQSLNRNCLTNNETISRNVTAMQHH
tara:strand:- start:2527 stop:2904 length:378 start_codon:yes stop_codon:yes gene_type:complete